jgi:Fe-S-cluster containining protein
VSAGVVHCLSIDTAGRIPALIGGLIHVYRAHPVKYLHQLTALTESYSRNRQNIKMIMLEDATNVIPIVTEKRRQRSKDKCASCKGSLCCTYVTQPIPTPRSKQDFSNLLWQVSHAGVRVFRDEGIWYLLFEGRCTHLQPDGRCGIYETRPDACRDHSTANCEIDIPHEEGFDLHFKDYGELLAFCRNRFKNWEHAKSSEVSEKRKVAR